MEYKINPAACANMCFIPVSIIDDNLKLASPSQLKTILYFFRRSTVGQSVEIEEIAKATGYGAEDIEDALIFWEERGLIVSDAAQISFESESEEPEQKPKAPHRTEEIPVVKPSFEQVSERISKDEEVHCLFNEAQQILGKTIGFSGQSTLLMILDSYGMPVEVLLMLIQFAKTTGKTGFTYISNLAKLWADKEILTMELAEEYITEQLSVDENWREFRRLTGQKNEYPTTKQRECFSRWCNEYTMPMELIQLAYEKAIEQTGKFSTPYMEKILASWNSKNIKTIAGVNQEEEAHKAAMAEKAAKKNGSRNSSAKNTDSVNSSDSSYDLNKFANLGVKG